MENFKFIAGQASSINQYKIQAFKMVSIWDPTMQEN